MEGRRPLAERVRASDRRLARTAAAERAEALMGEALTQGRASGLVEIETSLGEARSYIGALLADR
jgi:hypothetical protein